VKRRIWQGGSLDADAILDHLDLVWLTTMRFVIHLYGQSGTDLDEVDQVDAPGLLGLMGSSRDPASPRIKQAQQVQ
jgi:hypothetical protein